MNTACAAAEISTALRAMRCARRWPAVRNRQPALALLQSPRHHRRWSIVGEALQASRAARRIRRAGWRSNVAPFRRFAVMLASFLQCRLSPERGSCGSRDFAGGPGRGPAISIELNKLEPAENACRGYFVVDNRSPEPLKELQIDVFLFDKQDVVLRRSLSPSRSPHSRIKVVLFDLADINCEDIGRLLVNDVLACTDADGAAIEGCADIVGVTTRTAASSTIEDGAEPHGPSVFRVSGLLDGAPSCIIPWPISWLREVSCRWFGKEGDREHRARLRGRARGASRGGGGSRAAGSPSRW